jgi:uncharacterized phage-associated protein
MVDLIAPGLVSDFMLVEGRERGEILTNLKLQKLLYYAQPWHLALNDRPLFDEDFEAWSMDRCSRLNITASKSSSGAQLRSM